MQCNEPFHNPCCDRREFKGECFLPEICEEYQRLCRRHETFQTKNERIQRLAEPRYHVQKFVHKCECYDEKPQIFEIIREGRRQTRTEQLAYPSTRKLLQLKRMFGGVLGEERLDRVNRYIRKSFFTFYSRLGNVQPPPERVKVKKWSKRQWRKHTRYFRKLAKPKKVPQPPKIVPVWKPIEKMSRYIQLAIPKDRREEVKPPWKFTEGLRVFQRSARMSYLGVPRDLSPGYLAPFQLPIKVSVGALKYRATPRILELSKPYEYRGKDSDMKENPFGVNPDALTYKISKRSKKLAEPREFDDVHTRKNPTEISKAALNAKPTPRLIELSQPRKPSQQ